MLHSAPGLRQLCLTLTTTSKSTPTIHVAITGSSVPVHLVARVQRSERLALVCVASAWIYRLRTSHGWPWPKALRPRMPFIYSLSLLLRCQDRMAWREATHRDLMDALCLHAMGLLAPGTSFSVRGHENGAMFAAWTPRNGMTMAGLVLRHMCTCMCTHLHLHVPVHTAICTLRFSQAFCKAW